MKMIQHKNVMNIIIDQTNKEDFKKIIEKYL